MTLSPYSSPDTETQPEADEVPSLPAAEATDSPETPESSRTFKPLLAIFVIGLLGWLIYVGINGRSEWGTATVSTSFGTSHEGWTLLDGGVPPSLTDGRMVPAKGAPIRLRHTASHPSQLAVELTAVTSELIEGNQLYIAWYDKYAPRTNNPYKADALALIKPTKSVSTKDTTWQLQLYVKRRLVAWHNLPASLTGSFDFRLERRGNNLQVLLNEDVVCAYTAPVLARRYLVELGVPAGMGLASSQLFHRAMPTEFTAIEVAHEFFQEHQYAAAAVRYQQLLRDDPNTAGAESAQYYLGLCQWLAKRPGHALKTWNGFKDEQYVFSVSHYAIRHQYTVDKGNALNALSNKLGAMQKTATPAQRHAWLILIQDLMIQEANVTSVYYRTLRDLSQSYFPGVDLYL